MSEWHGKNHIFLTISRGPLFNFIHKKKCNMSTESKYLKRDDRLLNYLTT